MKRILTAVLLVATCAAGAQEMRMLQPQAADPDHPGTKVATAVAEALLSADAERAVVTVSGLATPAYRDGSLADDVRGFVARIGRPDAYWLENTMLGPDGILVMLRETGDGGGMLPIVVQMEFDEPHRVLGLRTVQARMRRPD